MFKPQSKQPFLLCICRSQCRSVMTQAKAWVGDLWIYSFLANYKLLCNAKLGKGVFCLLWLYLKPSSVPESTQEILPLNGITPTLLADRLSLTLVVIPQLILLHRLPCWIFFFLWMQSDVEFTARVSLNIWFPCLYFARVGIPGLCHHASWQN